MTLISLLIKVSLVLGLAALVQTALARRTSAATRHLIWTLAMTGVVILPLLAIAVPEWAPVERTIPAGAPAAIGDSFVSWTWTSDASRAAVVPVSAVRVPWALVFAIAYAAGVVLLLTRLALQHVWTRRIVRASAPVRDTRWLALLDECTAALGIRRRVCLLRTDGDTMPMAAGLWDADIVIPASADTWSGDRRRAVLLHELAHIDRRDCLTQTLAGLACAVYWMHPGVWWIAARLRAERELACDDRVLTAGEDARAYAGHLLELAYTLGHSAAPASAVAMARTGELEGRMLAALDDARNRVVPPRGSRLAGLALLCVVTVPVAAATITPRVHVIDGRDLRWGALRGSAQNTAPASQQRPRFDVASIKRTPADDTRPGADFGAQPGGRLVARNNPVANFITNAFGVPNYLVVGAPDWVREDRYDIEARAEGDPSRPQMMLMLQSLLEDRFQMRAHRETREVPAYVLTVARGGARLQASKDGGCISERDPSKPIPLPAPGTTASRLCGNNNMNGRVNPPFLTWTGVRIEMAQVAATLSTYFRRPVVDRTGLTGFYDIQIDLPPLQPVAGATDSGESVFTVLQEKLGLRVEEGRGPADVLVIDRIERPTAN